LKEQIVKELLVFFLMTTLLAFLAIGFYVLSANDEFVTTLTTAMMLTIGGGANIPLSQTDTDRKKEKERFVKKIKATATEDAALTKKRVSMMAGKPEPKKVK